METLNAYLDTLFLRYPQSPQFTTAKEDLREMMGDKYDALIEAGTPEHKAVAQVIAEFGDLQELAPALGLHNFATAAEAPTAITEGDLETYLRERQNTRLSYARGIMLLIAPFALLPFSFIAVPSEYYIVSLPLMLAATIALFIWGVYTLVNLESLSKPFLTKVKNGYQPTQDAYSRARAALAETSRLRKTFTFLGALCILVGIAAYIFAIKLSVDFTDFSELFFLGGIPAFLLATGIGGGLIAYAQVEREVLYKLETANRRHFLPQNSPYVSMRILAALIIPACLAIYILTLLFWSDPASFWLYLLLAGLTYWVLYLTNRALIHNSN